MPWAGQRTRRADPAGTTTASGYGPAAGAGAGAGTATGVGRKRGSRDGTSMSFPITLAWLLAFASWATALGGMIALTVSCHNGGGGLGTSTTAANSL